MILPAIGGATGIGTGAATGAALSPVTFGISAAIVGVQALLGWFKSNAAKNVYEDNVVAKLNSVEQTMQSNLQTYLNSPLDAQLRAASIQVAQAGIQWLMGPEFAQNQNLRDDWRQGGVADRSRGGKYDWYAMYLDPIVNDPRMQDISTSASLSNIAGSLGISQMQLAAIALGFVVALVFMVKH